MSTNSQWNHWRTLDFVLSVAQFRDWHAGPRHRGTRAKKTSKSPIHRNTTTIEFVKMKSFLSRSYLLWSKTKNRTNYYISRNAVVYIRKAISRYTREEYNCIWIAMRCRTMMTFLKYITPVINMCLMHVQSNMACIARAIRIININIGKIEAILRGNVWNASC